MIRAIKRKARHVWAEWRVRERRAALAETLGHELGHPVTLRVAGAAGRDSVYVVEGPAGPAGMVRLANPWRRRRALPPELPVRWPEDDSERLDREWQALRTAGPVGLAPMPLWRNEQALLCARIEGPRLSDLLFARPARFWELLDVATRAIAELHALGLTHMDACLANAIALPGTSRCALIDFEYAPAAGLGLAEQQAYDFLHLADSSLKFLPAGIRGDFPAWVGTLEEVAGDVARSARIAPLAAGLPRVLAWNELTDALAPVFPDLGQTRPVNPPRA